VDSAGNAYVAGTTGSANFPTTVGALDPTLSGGDAFVAKFSFNQPPVANAGADQTVSAGANCQALVALNGNGSSDSNGDALTFTWTGPFGTATGATPTVSLPLGTHTLTLTVSDGNGGTASDTVVVTVQDTTAPALSNVPGPIVVGATGLAGTPVTVLMPTATDNCGTLVLTSDAPALFPLGTTTVTFTVKDLSGNTATTSTRVTVVETPGRAHGEGHLDADGKRYHFEFRVHDRANGQEGGHLDLRVREHLPGRDRDDHDEDRGNHGRRFVSTTIAPVIFSDSPTITPGRRPQPAVDTVEFAGTGRWKGKPGYTFVARATDAGEPGRRRDTFAITIKDPQGAIVATVAGTLSGGNIQSLRLRPDHQHHDAKR
jgi:hypothetical protein